MFAGDEAFCSQNSRFGIDFSIQSVDGNDVFAGLVLVRLVYALCVDGMRRLYWIFDPMASRNLGPIVVVDVGRFGELHSS